MSNTAFPFCSLLAIISGVPLNAFLGLLRHLTKTDSGCVGLGRQEIEGLLLSAII